MLRYDALRQTQLNTNPYPYLTIENAFQEDFLQKLLNDFPTIKHPGSIPYDAVESGPEFQALIEELNSDKYRSVLEAKFDVNLAGCPTMFTVRGVMRQKDGRIHTDSQTKVITVLFYFNDDWQEDGGYLRILRNGQNMDDYVQEIPPNAGRMVAFQVTNNCWHGHKPVVGKRLSIQMNYLVGEGAWGKHKFFHGLSAKLKKYSPDFSV
jgi:SM-20-related protein